jgi:hypothetical protein
MNLSQSQQGAAAGKAHPAVLPQKSAASGSTAFETEQRLPGYGLPCVKCHLYYPADLDACPTCHSTERVSPVVKIARPNAAQPVAEPVPNAEVVEQEREEFLRQFKSQLFEAHSQVVNAEASSCSIGEHTAQPEKAEVCKACYDKLQERLDICEAAMHMDLKEATQIIYDAVWADSSDPSKTYRNAAAALLGEVRKRSGINSLLGPFQPLSH